MAMRNMRDVFRIGLFVVVLLAIALLWTAAGVHGLGISPDSVGYLAAAHNIANGLGAVMQNGEPLISQPPLYPLVMAATEWFVGVPPSRSATALSMVLLGLNVLMAGLLLRRVTVHGGTALFFTALVYYPLFAVSQYAWSEPLFICMSLAAFLCLNRYFSQPNLVRLLHISLLVALASLTRYIGVTLAAAIGISLFGFHLQRRNGLSLVIGRPALFMVIALGPLGLWALRNRTLSGTFFGPRASSVFTFSENVRRVFQTYRDWFALDGTRGWITLIVSSALVIACILVLLRSRQTRRIDPLSEWQPFATYWLVYVVFLVITATRIAFDEIDSRLLSPIVVSGAVVILALTESILDKAKPYSILRRAIVVLLLVLGGVLFVGIVEQTADDVALHRQNGRGYNSVKWRNNALVHALRNDPLPADCVVYSNDPSGASYHLGIRVKKTPEKTYYNSNERTNDLASLQGQWPPEQQACLVWFAHHRRYLYTLDELKTIVTLEPLLRFGEDGVYRIQAR